ncbi:uncharacterized protein AB9X84_017210 isoform 2-T2 [Acanthopagrus schlegelii]
MHLKVGCQQPKKANKRRRRLMQSNKTLLAKNQVEGLVPASPIVDTACEMQDKMSKSCPALLREAANLTEEALSRTPPAPVAQSQQIPAAPSRTPVQEWKVLKDPAQAAKVFKENLLREHASGKPLRMMMDLGFSLDLGGMGRTLLFEGEPDHIVLAASEVLIESDLFRVAGRMLAHSFLHDGPCVTGLSPAVIHVLVSGDPEMATVATGDCPDLHIRSIIKLSKRYCLAADREYTELGSWAQYKDQRNRIDLPPHVGKGALHCPSARHSTTAFP